ncbi:putative DPH4 -like protein isoform 1 [Capsicum annuum]|nr:putative DPH4 -like protein isoform 1 [Capsicum annuum]
MKKKVILVTGASGYLGSRLCRELFNSGHHVKAFVRRTSDVSSLPPPTDGGSSGGTLELVYGDVTDYPSLVQACSGCHVIFHAAALVEHWLPDPSRFIAVNVGGLKNVLQAYKETGTIEKIVYTSSFFALGPTDGYVADESQVHPGKFFTTEYEKSKAVSDKVALDAASEGVPIVLAYPGVVYGGGKVTTANTVANMVKIFNLLPPFMAGNVVACMLVERFNGRLPGYIGQAKERFSFSHVDDVVNGHISAMDKGKPGERYLLTGQNASWKEVFDIAAMITQTKKPSFGIPIFILVFYGWMSVLLAKITGKIPLVSPPMVRMIKHQWAYSCDKAKAELGYHPRSLEEEKMTNESQVQDATTTVGDTSIATTSRANALQPMAPAEKLGKFTSEDAPEVLEETLDKERFIIVEAWKHSNFLCRNYILSGLQDDLYNVYSRTKTSKELWGSLERKYKIENTGIKKFFVARFLDFKLIDSESVVSQVQELHVIIHDLLAEEDNKTAERRSKGNSTINGAHIVEDDQNNSKKRKKVEHGSNQPKKKFKEKCFNFGKIGHKFTDCRAPKKGKKKDQTNMIESNKECDDLCAMVSEYNSVGNPREW